MKRTFTRQELYDLVWSTPISKLAEQFGISDRGLAKTCQKHQIPVPGRGYWARLESGQQPMKTPLRKIHDSRQEHVHVGGHKFSRRTDAEFLVDATKIAKDALPEDRLQNEPASAESATRSRRSAPPLSTRSKNSLQSLASRLRKAEVDSRSERVKVGWIEIDPASISRVMAFLDHLARRLQPYDIDFNTEGSSTEFVEDGSAVHFTVRSPKSRVDPRRGSFHRYDYIFTGKLTLEVHGQADGVKKNWAVGADRELTDFLDQIAESFRLSLAVKKQLDEQERERRARVAHRAHRRELSKKRKERETAREAFLQEIADARREAEALRQTIALMPETSTPTPEFERMIEWAKSRLADLEKRTQVDRLSEALAEKDLFPDPDELFDPEGEPPPGSGYWD